MKPRTNISATRRQAGLTLIEILVYLAVFTILTAIGTASFYFCWDHTHATISMTEDIEAALRAGEGWRTDVRAASGTISIETTAAGETVKIPEGKNEIIYRFAGGELWRELPAQNNSRRLLARVKTSDMKTGTRNGVSMCSWEVELTPKRKEMHFPLRFTFEAAQIKP